MLISQQLSCALGPDRAVRYQVLSHTIQRSVLTYKCHPGNGRLLHMLAFVGRRIDKGWTETIASPGRRVLHYKRKNWFKQVISNISINTIITVTVRK